MYGRGVGGVGRAESIYRGGRGRGGGVGGAEGEGGVTHTTPTT